MPKKPTRACVFRSSFIRENIDPRVQELWLEAYGKKPPFGQLRLIWKTKHCTQVDPYNSGCPYPIEDCGLAFLQAVQKTIDYHPARPAGYFRAVAYTSGENRADNKPLARDRIRTDVREEGHAGGRQGSSGTRHAGDAEGEMGDAENRLHRPADRPVRIGELLGALNLRPHQGPTKVSQEGDK